MRNQTTDNMGINLTDDFRMSSETPEEFLSSLDGLIGEVRVSTFKSTDGEKVTQTMANVISEGTIYTVYHLDDTNDIYVKI